MEEEGGRKEGGRREGRMKRKREGGREEGRKGEKLPLAVPFTKKQDEWLKVGDTDSP